ncbi:MAG TPA: hypothetical protein VFK14_10400 [Solirubrobacterales bacterium]|nr:hypothetical protein [Solirubrobacterales bacterium]
MTAVFCHKAPDRSAETWEQQLARFPHLEFALSDAAWGIASAVARRAAARRSDPTAPALEQGLDLFHTALEAHRVLARHWRRAEAAWEKAEQAEARVAAAKDQGRDGRGPAGPARAAWSQAIASFEQAERRESAWKRARAALELFGPDGRLNDRSRAAAEIRAAVGDLTGPEWSKVRNFLSDPRSLSFLDRMHRRLEAAEPRPAWRAAMAWRWWLRHGRPEPSDPVMELVRGVARDRPLDAQEQASYQRVAAVLRETFRASSAVECMNSVLRMQQSRHRRMTQPMLDLKRLYWNCRAFRTGPRKGRCPYRALGLALPTDDFWELLHTDPAELTQRLSTQGNTG